MAQQTQSKTTASKKQAAATKAMMAGAKGKGQQAPSPEERHQMIAMEAYHIAEQRGFQGDMALDDWLQAEAAVNAQFEAKH